jgi:hypothetical protein
MATEVAQWRESDNSQKPRALLLLACAFFLSTHNFSSIASLAYKLNTLTLLGHSSYLSPYNVDMTLFVAIGASGLT